MSDNNQNSNAINSPYQQKTSIWALFKQAVSGNEQYDFTQGSIRKAAFLLAVPMMLEMILESVFAVTDIFFVSSLGAEAVAVVGLTEAVITLLYAVAIGLSMAVTAMIARRIGEKNIAEANKVATQALWIGAITALLISVPGSLFAPHILHFMGASADVVQLGSSYTAIMLGSSISILYLFLLNAIFRGAGDAKIAMRSLWLASGINIVLDPILIFGWGPFPEMGLTGAAVATAIARGTGVLYQLYHLFSLQGKIQLYATKLRLDIGVITSILKVSVGGVLQFLIATASWVVLIKIVSDYGSDAVAGYTIAIRVVMFTLLPAWGMSNAAATLVGQNLGANLSQRAESSVWAIAKYNVIFLLLVALTFYFFTHEIIGVFSQDPTVLYYGSECLRFVAYGYGFYALGMTLIQAFNGAGDTMTPTAINVVCYWLLQIPMAYFLAHNQQLGPNGVFIAIMLAESSIAIIALVLFRRGKWKVVKV